MKKNCIAVICSLLLCSLMYGQTGGPGQPEFMQFKQAGTTNLVNPATGIFNYQVPLFSIGGYPINLSYQSGVQMTDVPSMVGLGWNLNAGSIVRTLRGLPDDFNGEVGNDKITKYYSVKPNETYGGKLDVDLEIAGLPIGLSVGAGLSVFYNTYKGWGLEPALRGSIGAKFKANENVTATAGLGMGMSVNSQSGVEKYLSPSVGLKMGSDGNQIGINLGKTWAVNSTEGLKSSFNANLSYSRYTTDATEKSVSGGEKVAQRSTDESTFASTGYASRSYLNNSFQPDIDYPFENTSGTFSGALGFDAYYVDPSIRVTGYFSKQTLATTRQEFSAVGCMYEQAQTSSNVMQDFNREKKLPYFIGQSRILPIPYKTPDIFNLNAQGVSMTFSVNKNDIGLVGDAQGMVTSSGMEAGLEANFGNLFKAGGNFGTTTSLQQTERWNPTQLSFTRDQKILDGKLYQPFVFKNNGETNLFNHAAFSLLGGYDALKFNVSGATALSQMLSNNKQVSSNIVDTNQLVRENSISYLTAGEATVSGFDKRISYYLFTGDNDGAFTTIRRDSAYRGANHLSEISLTKPDGMRYIFGTPVYSVRQVESNFNVALNAVNKDKNEVAYGEGSDNSINNVKGIDRLFESTITPAYATQFLITAVLNSDYRDLTGDGISDDDIGSYVKFSYYKDHDYRWRTPYGASQASYSRALRSDALDDKGTTVFGQKELWYIRSIESKTEIAFFYYSKRSDSYGVNGELGGFSADDFLRKLERITVYSKADWKRSNTAATPLKEFHFGYDYTLCQGTENSIAPGAGKLTLKKLDVTYERSQKGKLTPYLFTYSSLNPSYNIRDVNRWGYFQANKQHYSDCDNLSLLSNIDYPYASQDRQEMDKNAYAWNLTDIVIPGGGKINVDYEAHDYGYIQDKVPGQMFKVAGFTENGQGIAGNRLYDLSTNSNAKRIYFSLDALINNGNPILDKQELAERYIRDIRNGFLYYKFYVNMKGGQYEYISGYTKIKDYGISANGLYGYVEMDLVNTNDDGGSLQCSPIVRTALQFLRINRNALLYQNNFSGQPADFSSFISSLPSVVQQVGAQLSADINGVNFYCQQQGFCQDVDLSKSFVRLYNPIKNKIAGGSRVRKISMEDQWSTMTSGVHETKSYFTTFDYTTTENDASHNTPITISSGVADYEPLVGGDEISLKQPIFYSDIKKMAPDNEYYVETPVNESLFPAPQITYGKITMINNGDNPLVGRTGKTVKEFFTAKDYPVKVSSTEVDEKRSKTDFGAFQAPIVAIDQAHDFATVSQGFSIELNNMSGQPKSTLVYNQKGDRVSGEVFSYFDDNDHFTLVSNKGKITRNNRLGVSVEYTIDGRRNYNESVSSSFHANLNLSIIGIFPIPIIVPLYSEMTEKKLFQSLVINKVIHRNALLQSRTVFEQGATITSEFIAFDGVTGGVLLTKTANEFRDTLYTFKYPAWWMYPGMGPAYSNDRMIVNSSNLGSTAPLLHTGDELRPVTSGPSLWIKSTNGMPFAENASGLTGALPANDYRVYTSGAKNILADFAGEVVTWRLNPITTTGKLNFGNRNTLNASVTEYGEDGVLYCQDCDTMKIGLHVNEFLSGRKANYKPRRTWYYLDDRNPGPSASSPNIRTDGLFRQYLDFWRQPVSATAGWTIDASSWDWKEKVNLQDLQGNTIESEDRIGRKSSVVNGFKNTLVVAKAVNAGYNEIYAESFEDYNFSQCTYQKPRQSSNGEWINSKLKRVRITTGAFVLSAAQSHSGKYSLEISSPLSFTVSPPANCSGTIITRSRPKTTSVATLATATLIRPSIIKQIAANQQPVCDTCVGGFSPTPDKGYVFTCWVRVNNPQPITSNADASVIVSGGGTSVTFHAEGSVIEGWQRIMGSFRTPAFPGDVTVELRPGNAVSYFDDIRIFPDGANMVTYVYDELNLRYTYSLDENNYFTKNEYNNQGELIRVKKETEKGIVTMKESISSLMKHP